MEYIIFVQPTRYAADHFFHFSSQTQPIGQQLCWLHYNEDLHNTQQNSAGIDPAKKIIRLIHHTLRGEFNPRNTVKSNSIFIFTIKI